MDWKEKIEKGMELIKEGCVENKKWYNCIECPFDEFCTTLMENEMDVPENWNEKTI